MARYNPGPIAADISGSIGSLNFAVGRGGPIIRIKAPHRSNKSARQRQAQHTFGRAAHHWAALTQLQQTAWNNAAAAIGTATTDPSHRVTGYQLFMRAYARYATVDNMSAAETPTPLASSAVLLIIPSAHYDVPELSTLIYAPGVSVGTPVYFLAAASNKSYPPRSWRNWAYIGQGDYGSFPYDFISGWLASFGTPQNGQYSAIRAIACESGQIPSPSYVAPFRWHHS